MVLQLGPGAPAQGVVERGEELPRDSIEVLDVFLLENRQDALGNALTSLLDPLECALSGSPQLQDVLPAILFAAFPANPSSLNQRVERSPSKRRIGPGGACEIGLRNAAMSTDVA